MCIEPGCLVFEWNHPIIPRADDHLYYIAPGYSKYFKSIKRCEESHTFTKVGLECRRVRSEV